MLRKINYLLLLKSQLIREYIKNLIEFTDLADDEFFNVDHETADQLKKTREEVEEALGVVY